MEEFQDITITGMNREASRKSNAFPEAFDVALGLSSEPPREWEEIFEGVWNRSIYMMKRDARIEGSNILITCAPGEVEQEHLPKLKEAAAETNKRYRSFAASELARHERAKIIAESQSNELDELEKRLKKDQ
jgi:hypothetical protein